MNDLRCDHEVVKWIYKNEGAKAARDWQAVPLIEAPNVTGAHTPVGVRYFAGIPFDTMIVYCGSAGVFIKRESRSALECRMVFGESGAAMNISFRLYLSGCYIIHSYDDSQVFKNSAHLGFIDQGIDFFKAVLVGLIESFRKFLAVETTSTNAKPMQHKTKAKKPWLRTDLPTIILIDPSKPTMERRDHQGGTHATPIPHQVRGHWRTLRHPKYGQVPRQVRVKNYTVGDSEWIVDGRRYKVLDI